MEQLLRQNNFLIYNDLVSRLGEKQAQSNLLNFCKTRPQNCLVAYAVKKISQNQIVTGYLSYQQLYKLMNTQEYKLEQCKPLAIVKDSSFMEQCFSNLRKQRPIKTVQINYSNFIENKRIKMQQMAQKTNKTKSVKLNNNNSTKNPALNKQEKPKKSLKLTKHSNQNNEKKPQKVRMELPRVKSIDQGVKIVSGIQIKGAKHYTSDEQEESQVHKQDIRSQMRSNEQNKKIQQQQNKNNEGAMDIEEQDDQAQYQKYMQKIKKQKNQKQKTENRNTNLPIKQQKKTVDKLVNQPIKKTQTFKKQIKPILDKKQLSLFNFLNKN